MLKRFIDTCVKSKIFDNDKKLVVAVSGGADSLTLADLLYRSKSRFDLELCIAHFEHGLRGQDSIDDAEFVREFAKERDLKFVMESNNVASYAALKKISIETAARELRYAFLKKVRADLKFDAIALAHHKDDQAETILMRILRGAGAVGLSAMKVKSDDLIRPLLKFAKVELESYCQSRGITPRIDSTNFEATATRNKVRLRLLPLMKEFNPSIVESLCRIGETAAEDADFINDRALKVFTTAFDDGKLSKAVVKAQPVALQRALIRLYIEKAVNTVKDFEFIHIESIRRVIVDDLKGVELPHHLRVDARRGWIHINKN